jgi:hypothetical protein
MKSIFEYIADASNLVDELHALRAKMSRLSCEMDKAYKEGSDYYAAAKEWLDTEDQSKKVRRRAIVAIKKCYELFGLTAPEISSISYDSTIEQSLRTVVCWGMQINRITEQY